MKKFLMILSLVGLFVLLSENTQAQDKDGIKLVFADADSQLDYSLEAMTIINNKCYGCHSPSGRSDDAKEALLWMELQTNEQEDIIASLDEIVEVLEEGEMPPPKIVEKYPNMKMTDDEIATLKAWAESQLSVLMGE
jgi:uncharacterized membrane protein